MLTNSGMKNVGNPPSEADLKTYYSKNGPAHELITKGSYQEAAAEYRKLADKATDPGAKTADHGGGSARSCSENENGESRIAAVSTNRNQRDRLLQDDEREADL